MFGWITNLVGSVGGWLGSGIANLVDVVFGGIATIFAAIINAADGLWDVLDALWDFAMGFREDILALLTTFFPFVPVEVSAVLSMGIVAVVIAGIVKKART